VDVRTKDAQHRLAVVPQDIEQHESDSHCSIALQHPTTEARERRSPSSPNAMSSPSMTSRLEQRSTPAAEAI
jgi:hypothetical protein